MNLVATCYGIDCYWDNKGGIHLAYYDNLATPNGGTIVRYLHLSF